jgi:hypothetical protein
MKVKKINFASRLVSYNIYEKLKILYLICVKSAVFMAVTTTEGLPKIKYFYTPQEMV